MHWNTSLMRNKNESYLLTCINPKNVLKLSAGIGLSLMICFKSQAALEFTKDLVLSQLRYTGMLETIRIRKLGYHIRFSYQDFHAHFGLLLPREMKHEQLKENLGAILKKLGMEEDQFCMGNTKVGFVKGFSSPGTSPFQLQSRRFSRLTEDLC